MARKESKTTAKVESGYLYSDDPLNGAKVGTDQWFTWLTGAASFYYAGRDGTFTATKEKRQRGGDYWFAYRRSAGKLRRSYMGKSEALTPEKLSEIARKLADVQEEG